MNIGPVNTTQLLLLKEPKHGFFFRDNELVDEFQLLIGPDAMSVLVTLTRQVRAGQKLRYTTRELAKAIGRSAATVSRSLGILEYIGLIRCEVSIGCPFDPDRMDNLLKLHT